MILIVIGAIVLLMGISGTVWAQNYDLDPEDLVIDGYKRVKERVDAVEFFP